MRVRSRRSHLAIPIVVTVAGLAGCAPEPEQVHANPPPTPTMPVGNPPALMTGQPVATAVPPPEPLHVNPPPPHTVVEPPAATNPARVQKQPDGTCWEPFGGNPPGQRPVRCP